MPVLAPSGLVPNFLAKLPPILNGNDASILDRPRARISQTAHAVNLRLCDKAQVLKHLSGDRVLLVRR